MEQMKINSALLRCNLKAVYTNDLLKQLEAALEQYDQVLFFSNDSGSRDFKDIPEKFSQSKAVSSAGKRLLILSVDRLSKKQDACDFWHLKEKEAEALRQLYYLYEFSDNFQIISWADKNFATLFHFLETDILDLEDIFSALIQ